MRPSSSRFNPYRSHKIKCRATLLPSGVVIPITGGSVTLDVNAAVRATGSITVNLPAEFGLVPNDPESALAPFGNEIRISRGIDYEDGTFELVNIATLRIEQTTSASSSADLSIEVSGMDRAQRIIDAQFEAPYTIESGTDLVEAIDTLIEEADATIERDFPPTIEFELPKVVRQEGDDRWELAQGLAQVGGGHLYFDGDGVLVLAPIATSGSPVANISEGLLDNPYVQPNLLSATLEWDRGPAYNRVILTGDNADNIDIPRYVATDDDENSPTYYQEGDGRFGRKPLFVSSSLIKTEAQAQTAAEGMLEENRGIAERLSLEALVDPRLEPNDVVTVTREALGVVTETHVLEQVTIPLGPTEGMSATTRILRVVQ